MIIQDCIAHTATPFVYLPRQITRFENLTRCLVLSTPKAYQKLAGNKFLLKKLNDHLNLTGKINVELLQSYGLKAHLLPGGQAFGLSLISELDIDKYNAAFDELMETPGEVAVDLFKQMGIKIIGGENLIDTERTLALHRLIQFALGDGDYSKTGEIIIEPNISSLDITKRQDMTDGKQSFLIPAILLNLLDRPELLQVNHQTNTS